jgi:hypothetical protein
MLDIEDCDPDLVPDREGEMDGVGGYGGVGDVDPEPKRRRVEEKRREGSRRVEANWKHARVNIWDQVYEKMTSRFRSNLQHIFPSKAQDSSRRTPGQTWQFAECPPHPCEVYSFRMRLRLTSTL